MNAVEKLKEIDATLKAKGYGSVLIRFKSFGAENKVLHERFAVEKRLSPNGTDVVVKISELADVASTRGLRREAMNMEIMDAEMNEKLEGKVIRIGDCDIVFNGQKIVETFEDANFYYLVSNFCEDDINLEQSLTSNQRYLILLNTIKFLQTLNPEKLETKKSYLFTGLGKRATDTTILPADTLQTVEQINKLLRNEFETFPYVVVHSDIHGGNVALKRMSDKSLEVTIMDFERVHKGSRFEDYAGLYFTARVSTDIKVITEALKGFWLSDLVGKENEILKISLEASRKHEKAETFFRAWVINVALEKMIYDSKFDREPYVTIVKSGRDVIMENLTWFRESGLIK